MGVRAVHDMARAMTGVMTLLVSAWVFDPELSCMVHAVNRSYTETMHQVEDVLMTAYRTARFMTLTASPSPLGSYGRSLAARHVRGRRYLKAGIRDTLMHVNDLRRKTPSYSDNTRRSDTSHSSPLSDLGNTVVYPTPSPVNLINELPESLTRSGTQDDSTLVLPTFNESFFKLHKNSEMKSHVSESEDISEYNISSSLSVLSSGFAQYAPTTSPISPERSPSVPLIRNSTMTPPPPPPPSRENEILTENNSTMHGSDEVAVQNATPCSGAG